MQTFYTEIQIAGVIVAAAVAIIGAWITLKMLARGANQRSIQNAEAIKDLGAQIQGAGARYWKAIDELRRELNLVGQKVDGHALVLDPAAINRHHEEKARLDERVERMDRDLGELRDLVLLEPARERIRTK